MHRIALPDGTESVTELREEDARRHLDGFTGLVRGLHLLHPVTFELRRYADADATEYEVIDSVTIDAWPPLDALAEGVVGGD